jgi:hypothetical protein
VTRAKAGTEEARASRRPGAPAPPAAARPPRWMLLAEATGRDALDAAGELLAGDAGLGGRGATGITAFHVYRLMIALT